MKHPLLSTLLTLLALLSIGYLAVPAPCEAGRCPDGQSKECVETEVKCEPKTRSKTVRNEDGTVDVEIEEYEDCSQEECVRYECR